MNAVTITQKLVKVGRYSGDEGDTAKVVESIMKELGFSHRDVLECGTIVGFMGPEDEPIGVLFDSHIDIATVSGEWSFEPYCGEIQNGRILGRGTTDMKAGLAASLYAVAEFAKNNKQLKKRIAVSASVLEEQIEGFGIEELLQKYKPESVVICEPSELDIMIGQKGRIEIMLTVYGKSAHASNPEVGINSMLIAADALKILQTLEPPMNDSFGAGILVPTDIITEPYPSISAVPAKTKIRFDRRTLPGETEQGVLEEISNCLKKQGITEFDIEAVKTSFSTYTNHEYVRTVSLPPWSLDTNSSLFEAMYKGVKAVFPDEKPRVSVWKCCTNGSQSAGVQAVPTIGMGPGSIKEAHIVDEFIEISQVEKVVEIYLSFLNNMGLR